MALFGHGLKPYSAGHKPYSAGRQNKMAADSCFTVPLHVIGLAPVPAPALIID